MRFPAALAPLRHALFRSLWLANVTGHLHLPLINLVFSMHRLIFHETRSVMG
jgi:hypothetical protein